jgi:ABC-type polysaccharide/polyol phosphate transport system ATPase subunit
MVEISLDRVSLNFKVRRFRNVTLKEFLVRGMFSRATNPVIHVHALQDISLHVGEGERLGIIGHNGAGKSTLLKLLAGIYPPSSGSRSVRGRISSLFDITLGFEPDASGWENMYYRGYLQGETPRTIQAKVEEIAAFTELGEFLDMPVRYYSAGMMIRLAFAIATASEPEILIVDEVLSVGDLSFQQKASQRIRGMMAQARLMVIVSHDLNSLQNLCTRIAWLDHGHLRQVGPPAATIAAYQAHVQRAAA